MTILVLGSEGFIGSNLVKHFLSRSNRVYGCDLFEAASQSYIYRKISRLSPELDELFSGARFDVCINASGSGNVNYSMTHPFSDFEANSLDTMRILDSIRRIQPSCKYLHFSSAAVYGNPERLPVNEEDSKKPLSPYGWHKLISEHLCSEYSLIYGLKTIVMRPFSVYGPGLRKQIFWDLYKKIIQSADIQVELWGNGTETRDFIHVDDLLQCIDLLIHHASMQGDVYNIASGADTGIRQIAETFCHHIAKEKSVVFNNQVRAGDPLNWKADISKIMALGFIPKIPIEIGIQNVADWIKENY